MRNYIVRKGRMVIKVTSSLEEALLAFEQTLINDWSAFSFQSLMRLTLERHDERKGWHVLVLGTQFGIIDSNYTSQFPMSIKAEVILKRITGFSQTCKSALGIQ